MSCCLGIFTGPLHGLWGNVCTRCEVCHHSLRRCVLCTAGLASPVLQCNTSLPSWWIDEQSLHVDLGPLKSFVGIQFECDCLTQEIWIHQEMYINSLLAEHDLTSCNAVVTPLDPSFPLGHDEATYPAVLMHAYQHLVGSLLFLQLCLQPDISFAVLLLSQFCSAPSLIIMPSLGT